MFGFLKNILGKAAAPAAPNPVSARPVTPPRTFEGSSSSGAKPAVPQRNGQHANGRGVQVPLQPIVTGLPLELQGLVRQKEVGDLAIAVPLEKILPQLAHGVVKISFSELRQAVPHIFDHDPAKDRLMVCLPLADIVARLNPALLTRRRVQRQVEVPSDIGSPFDPQGNSLRVAAAAAPAEPPPPAPKPSAPVRTPAPSAPVATPPSAPGNGHIPLSRQSLTSAPRPAPPGAAPLPPSPVIPAARPDFQRPAPPATFQKPAAPTPPPAPALPRLPVAPPAPVAPAMPAVSAHSNQTVPASAASGLSASTDPSGPAPIRMVGTEVASLTIGLTLLAEGWPDPVRKEILQMGLVDSKLAIPVDMLERTLRQGRVAFPWKVVRTWLKPAVPPATSSQDGTILDLPLKVVAPLFLARQKEQRKAQQQKVEIDENIPNLFFGFPQPEPVTPGAAPVPKAADTNIYVWEDGSESVRDSGDSARRPVVPSVGTQFVSKYATPNEIVSRAAAIDGVAGALIALPDGLLVASRLPQDLNADTLAAFLPQIFGKMSQCTKELRMGELNNLNFTVGNVPWKIFRVNAIFFAAFGRSGEPLPTAQLAALAAELDHKPK